ncbi:MAG: HNH endonuclease, partial [Candidatus Dechloromonas phosphoritropha]
SFATILSASVPSDISRRPLPRPCCSGLKSKSDQRDNYPDTVGQQAAITGRTRTISGLRGTYPGLALGSNRELTAFLEAWSQFAQGQEETSGQSATPGGVLSVAGVEKAAIDAGFDLTPTRDGSWLVFRSTAFPYALGVSPQPADCYQVGFSAVQWGQKLAEDCGHSMRAGEEGSWFVLADLIARYDNLHRLLQRAAALARILTGEGVEQFRAASQGLPASTEVERLVIQRVGQKIFRQLLIEYWQRRWAVTGLDLVPLLRASHIKPWAKCDSDAERLDVFNGVLLAPHLDALFDDGWISFGDDGKVLVSPMLTASQKVILGIHPDWKLAGLADQHRNYLDYHRQVIFRS